MPFVELMLLTMLLDVLLDALPKVEEQNNCIHKVPGSILLRGQLKERLQIGVSQNASAAMSKSTNWRPKQDHNVTKYDGKESSPIWKLLRFIQRVILPGYEKTTSTPNMLVYLLEALLNCLQLVGDAWTPQHTHSIVVKWVWSFERLALYKGSSQTTLWILQSVGSTAQLRLLPSEALPSSPQYQQVVGPPQQVF